jgi:hypothetical protein
MIIQLQWHNPIIAIANQGVKMSQEHLFETEDKITETKSPRPH